MNRPQVTDEPVEFEKQWVEVQDFRKTTIHFRAENLRTMNGENRPQIIDEPVKFESNSHESSTYKCNFLVAYYCRAPTLNSNFLRMSLGTSHELIACKSNKKSRGRKTHWERGVLEAKGGEKRGGRL